MLLCSGCLNLQIFLRKYIVSITNRKSSSLSLEWVSVQNMMHHAYISAANGRFQISVFMMLHMSEWFAVIYLICTVCHMIIEIWRLNKHCICYLMQWTNVEWLNHCSNQDEQLHDWFVQYYICQYAIYFTGAVLMVMAASCIHFFLHSSLPPPPPPTHTHTFCFLDISYYCHGFNGQINTLSPTPLL